MSRPDPPTPPTPSTPSAGDHSTRPRPSGSAARIAAAYLLAALAPYAAWLVWISGTAYASDAQNVAWFVTVAVTTVFVGVLAPPRWAHRVPLAGIAVVAAVATLFGWWSSEDETGLFLVGIVLATPLMLAAAPLLLLLGGALAAPGRR